MKYTNTQMQAHTVRVDCQINPISCVCLSFKAMAEDIAACKNVQRLNNKHTV